MTIALFLWVLHAQTQQQTQDSKPLPILPLHQATSSDLSDLEPLGARLESVRLVALGEANHGTAEFFRYKNRIIRYLVTQHGFTTFLIESGTFSCEQLNAYVHGADIDLGKALLDQQYTIWFTQEVAELFVWMRDYNRKNPPSKQVRVAGFDSRDNGHGRDLLKDYLAAVDSTFFNEVAATLDQVTLTGFGDKSMTVNHNQTLHRIAKHMANQKARWITQTSQAEFQRATQALKVLQQAGAYAAAKNGSLASDGRDAAMAENVKVHAATPGKIVLWAHNGHVAVGDNGVPGGKSLGTHMRQWLGDAYFTLGFSFGEGTFRAYGQQNDQSNYFPFPTGKPFPGSTGAALSPWSDSPFLVILRSLNPSTTALKQPLAIRWADGAVQADYRERWQENPQQLRWRIAFDALLHVPKIHAAETYSPKKL